LIQTGEFHRVVREGIPDCHRSHIWKICSGGLYKSILAEKSYGEILEENKGKESLYTDMISRDLHRSLPEHPYYQSKEGLSALQNVLSAYSWRNPIIGYCQAMNYIVAALLLYMDEASTFWTLAAICEDIVPSNYRPQMLGSLVEQKIFEFLLEYFMPDIAKHFHECDVPVSVITAQWFLCLFIGHVPLEVAFRILDRWFCVNTDALFQVGLALIKLRKNELFKAKRVEQFSFVFKEHNYDTNELLQLAWARDFMVLPRDQMHEIKNEHQFVLIQSLHQNVKSKIIQKLTRNTHFNKVELQPFVDKWHEVLQPNSDGIMDFLTFVKIVPEIFPFWNDLVEGDLPAKLYGCFVPDSGSIGLLKLEDFIQGLNLIYKGTLEELWQFCCKMYSADQSKTITKRQLNSVLTIFTRLFQPKPNSFGISFVVDSDTISHYIEEKANLANYEETGSISTELLGTPQEILEFFNLKEEAIKDTFKKTCQEIIK